MTPAAGAHNNDVASCGHAGAGYDEGTGSGMCDDGDIEQCSMSVGPPRGTSVLVGLRLPVPILASSGGDGANEEARVYDGCDDEGWAWLEISPARSKGYRMATV